MKYKVQFLGDNYIFYATQNRIDVQSPQKGEIVKCLFTDNNKYDAYVLECPRKYLQ